MFGHLDQKLEGSGFGEMELNLVIQAGEKDNLTIGKVMKDTWSSAHILLGYGMTLLKAINGVPFANTNENVVI